MMKNEGKILKELMIREGLKQSDLARILGINQSTISLYLSGQKGIGKKTLRKIAQKFNISAGVFLEETQKQSLYFSTDREIRIIPVLNWNSVREFIREQKKITYGN